MIVYIPKNKQWKDLTTGQRAGIVVMAAVQILLLIMALVDIRRRPPERIRGSKRLWTAAAFVTFFGPISYFLAGRK